MINLTSLLLYLLSSVCGASLAQDVCREVVIKKAGDCDVKMACCRAAPPGVCCQAIIKKAGDCRVRTGCCGPGPHGACCRACIKKPGDGCPKSGCCPGAPPGACCQAIIKKAGGGDVKTACRAATTPELCRQLILTGAGDSGVQAVCGANVLTLVGPDDDEKKIIVRKLKEEGPKVWIGVRVSPVPESLASHLKRGGLMIANVAKDSPADRAGVERYDVVVSFAGNALEEMDDLVQAIRDTGAENTAEMVVIRGGKEKTLTITPTKGGDPGAWVMKYEEPEEPEVDQLKEYFGGRLKVGPGDVRIYMPYGRLGRLPKDIEKMLEDMPDVDWEEWSENWEEWSEQLKDWSKQFKHFEVPFDVEIDIDADDWGRWHDEGDVKAEIHIRVKEDGMTITIERAEDGTITIEREDPDGARSSETYENIDQLRKEDPEVYKTYRRFLVLRSPRAFIVSPDLEDLGVRQHEFQIELKAQLDKARQQVEEAREQVRKARKQVEIRKKEIAGDKSAVEELTKSVMILVVDGHITLEITEDGVSKKYEFDSREDFRDSEPELYERFKKHLDDADAGAGIDKIEPAFARQVT